MYFKVRARVFAFVWLTVDRIKFANSAVLDGICCCLLYVFYVCTAKAFSRRTNGRVCLGETVRLVIWGQSRDYQGTQIVITP